MKDGRELKSALPETYLAALSRLNRLRSFSQIALKLFHVRPFSALSHKPPTSLQRFKILIHMFHETNRVFHVTKVLIKI